MPRFFFDICDDGSLFRDLEGVELADVEAAHGEANQIASDVLRDHLDRVRVERTIEIRVRDTRRDLFRRVAKVTSLEEPAPASE
jgi:hypothetical protein